MEKIWYYRNLKQKEGPFTDNELIKLIRNGIIGPQDEIWMVDMDNWIAIEDSNYSFYLPQQYYQ